MSISDQSEACISLWYVAYHSYHSMARYVLLECTRGISLLTPLFLLIWNLILGKPRLNFIPTKTQALTSTYPFAFNGIAFAASQISYTRTEILWPDGNFFKCSSHLDTFGWGVKWQASNNAIDYIADEDIFCSYCLLFIWCWWCLQVLRLGCVFLQLLVFVNPCSLNFA